MANNAQQRLMPFFPLEVDGTFQSPYLLEDYIFSKENTLIEPDTLINDPATFDPVRSQNAVTPVCFDPYTFRSPWDSPSTIPQNTEYTHQLSPTSMLNFPPAPPSPVDKRPRQSVRSLTRSSSSSTSFEPPTEKPKSTRKAKASHPSRSRRRPAPSSRRQTGAARSQDYDRSTHNMIEKQYRTRLNNQFNALFLTLPSEARAFEGETDDKKASKGEILLLARRYICDLEKKGKDLRIGVDGLKARTESLERVWMLRSLDKSRLPH